MKRRILLIEGYALHSMIIKEEFECAGYSVELAENPWSEKGAIEQFSHPEHWGIVMEMRFGSEESAGAIFLERVHKMGLKIPILIATSVPKERVLESLERLKVPSPYILQKPFVNQNLVDAWIEVCDNFEDT